MFTLVSFGQMALISGIAGQTGGCGWGVKGFMFRVSLNSNYSQVITLKSALEPQNTDIFPTSPHSVGHILNHQQWKVSVFVQHSAFVFVMFFHSKTGSTANQLTLRFE